MPIVTGQQILAADVNAGIQGALPVKKANSTFSTNTGGIDVVRSTYTPNPSNKRFIVAGWELRTASVNVTVRLKFTYDDDTTMTRSVTDAIETVVTACDALGYFSEKRIKKIEDIENSTAAGFTCSAILRGYWV